MGGTSCRAFSLLEAMIDIERARPTKMLKTIFDKKKISLLLQ